MLAPPENEFAVQLSYQGRKGWITCGEVKFDDINLKAMCGLGTIDVSPKVPGLLLNLELIIPDYYKGSVDLKKQDE